MVPVSEEELWVVLKAAMLCMVSDGSALLFAGTDALVLRTCSAFSLLGQNEGRTGVHQIYYIWLSSTLGGE